MKVENQIKQIKQILLLFTGSLFGAGLAFLLQIILARNLSIVDYGNIASVLAFCTILIPLVGLGVPNFWLKIYGREGDEAVRWLRGSSLSLIASGVSVLVLTFIWFEWLTKDWGKGLIFYLLVGYLFSQIMVELASVRFQLEAKFHLLSIWQAIPHLLRFISISFLIYIINDNSVISVSLVYLITSLVIIIIGLILLFPLYNNKLNIYGHGGKKDTVNKYKEGPIKVIKNSWPFGISGFLYLIYFQSSIVVLKVLDSSEAAAKFNIIFIILQAVYILPTVIFQKYMMPKIHRLAYSNLIELNTIYKNGTKIMGGLGGFFMLITMIGSPFFIPFVFGPDYREVILPLIVISLSIPIRFISTCAGSILATKENIKIRIKYMFITAIVNLMLNVFLIPEYGLHGAVASAIICDVLILYFYNIAVRKFFTNNVSLG